MTKQTSTVSKLYYIFFVLLLGITASGIAFFRLDSPVSKEGEPVLFSVPRGASVRIITQTLQDRTLIRSSFYAYYYTRILNLSLKAGTYRISSSMRTSAILRYIAEGKQEYTRVTVPEGLSLMKTAKHLEDAGIVSSAAFLEAARNTTVLADYGLPGNNAEGFLFPDTYFFPIGSEAESVVHTMISTFFTRISSLKNVPLEKSKLYDKVILASIVEREYRVESEAPIIASVFVNRLGIGMGLQSCATIEYILTEIQNKPHPLRLTLDELKIPSEYNTYLWAGLPPGPISSPGLVALEAAFTPSDTHFLYFRLTDTEAGTHSFTRSLDEHVQAGRTLVLKKAAGN